MGEDQDGEKIRCMKWMKLRGIDPQSGQEIDEYKCKEIWSVILQVENAKETRQTAASVDAHRNVFVRAITKRLNENDFKEIPEKRFINAEPDPEEGGHPPGSNGSSPG